MNVRLQEIHRSKETSSFSVNSDVQCDANAINIRPLKGDSLNQAVSYTENPSRCNGGSSIHIPIKVKGISMSALLDTGAEVTVINEKFVTELNLYTSGKIPVKGINMDSKIMADLCPNIDFTIQNTQISWQAVAMPMTEDVIIGLDFMIMFIFCFVKIGYI